MTDADELIDYEEEEETTQVVSTKKTTTEKTKKGSYVGIHSTGFRDFLLKPELLRAIVDCGFEHPSEGTLLCFLWWFLLLFILLYVSPGSCSPAYEFAWLSLFSIYACVP